MAGAMGDDNLVRLVGFSPEADRAAQQKRLLASRTPPVRAVLSGGLDHPQVAGALGDDPAAVAQLRMLIANARSANFTAAPKLPVSNVAVSSGSLLKERADTAQIAQVALFLLTLMLSTMVLSQLIEEKSNKIIEVIAAAIPIDAMFVGKLFAMLSASVLGLVVWIGVGRAADPAGQARRPPDAAGAGGRLAGLPRARRSSISR